MAGCDHAMEPGAEMKVLINRNGSYLTGDELADAVMDYGLALARNREIDIVDIPFLASDGSVGRVQLTVGWNLDTTSTSAADANHELLEPETTRALNAKADSIEALHAHPFSLEEVAQLRWPVIDSSEWV